MSNSNPSRIGFEMIASGLKVIEYDSEFTKYDMPFEYFTKIKNCDNIISIIEKLLDNDNIVNDFINTINLENENIKCYNLFLTHLQ